MVDVLSMHDHARVARTSLASSSSEKQPESPFCRFLHCLSSFHLESRFFRFACALRQFNVSYPIKYWSELFKTAEVQLEIMSIYDPSTAQHSKCIEPAYWLTRTKKRAQLSRTINLWSMVEHWICGCMQLVSVYCAGCFLLLSLISSFLRTQTRVRRGA